MQILSKSTLSALLVAGFLFSAQDAFAQVNNFFGQNLPTADGATNLTPGQLNQPNSPYENTSPQGNWTDDEKRMQKKYHISMKHARSTISKGEALMKGQAPDSKEYKKGKIFKEIGEKQLADLEAANPLKKLAQDGAATETDKAQSDKNAGAQQ